MHEILSLPYHQPAFLRLAELYEKQTNHVLIHKYAEYRGRLFLDRFQVGQTFEGESAWNLVREVLDYIDHEVQKIVVSRSVAYWLHIYRRVGVTLSPKHEDKTDHVTVGLVRQIAELFIQKHGLRVGNKEFGRSDLLGLNAILGGWLKRGLKRLKSKDASSKQILHNYSLILKSDPNWVIRDFSKSDFINIYAIEGAAYQYWRLTALLRALGKGAKIVVDDTGDWQYVPDPLLHQLVLSIDERNQNTSSFSSLIGVWIDDQTIMGSNENSDTDNITDVVFFPVYNLSRDPLPENLNVYGIHISKKSVFNFYPFYINANSFFINHDFMREEFRRRRGYDFELIICVLVGLSSFSYLPNRALYAVNESERQKIKLSSFIQTLTRGYYVFPQSEDIFVDILIERLSMIFSIEFDHGKIQNVLSSFALSDDIQKKISPWSNGPRSLVIPSEDICVVDLVSLPAYLRSIFTFMPDQFGDSGTVFEKLFREALVRRNYNITYGDLITKNGSKRELDASVIIKDRMYLFECVSIERPLDYEIGKPKSMKTRIIRLSEKLAQASSLRDFILEHPSGRNYDFSDIREVVPIVVSPFVEWIWETGPELWLDSKTPRILAPDEVFTWLETRAQ